MDARDRRPAIRIPVCLACRDHALQTRTAAIVQWCVLLIGLCTAAAGIWGLLTSPPPMQSFLIGMTSIGAAMSLGALTWMRADRRRAWRERGLPGHHPRLLLGLEPGRTLLVTSNDALAAELLELNPGARRLPLPRSLQQRRERQLPAARAVRSPDDASPGGRDGG